MRLTSHPFFRKYLLPGVIFQSVVIAGGYGTGREIVQYFLNFGPVGGLLSMAVSAAMWAVLIAATIEFARVFRAYDYRAFFKKLLGRWWFLFEVCYLTYLMILMAVIASASGHILEEALGLHYYVGVIGILLGTAVLVFKGSKLIEVALSFWSVVLYAVFIVFVTLAFLQFGDKISGELLSGETKGGWWVAGFQYAFYNMGVIPVVLFATRYIETRKQALWAGLFAGIIGIVPALLLLLSLMGQYPQVLDVPVPTNFMLGVFGSPWFFLVYQIMLFGTLIETSTGCIHAVNDRIKSLFDEKGWRMGQWVRPVVATLLLAIGAVLAQFGLVGLIAQGYGTIAWGFMAVFVLPVLTLGVWKSVRAGAPGGRRENLMA
jgi:uncharacterized membrane protein YkvI